MGKSGWRWVQAAIGAVILFFLVRSTMRTWDEIRTTPIHWQLRWSYIVASLLVTWVMYAVLVWGWRLVLHGWGQWLRAVDAARIWTLSSLGKYIPGKVWTIAGMAMMAEKAGVSGAAATGSAIIMQLLAIATGAVLSIALLGTIIFGAVPGGSFAAIGVAVAALVGAISLTSPSVTRRIGFMVRRPDAVQPVDPNALAGAIFANLTAWAGYGLSLQLLLAGTIPSLELSWSVATGAFAASYLIGFLNPFLPGGIGGREVALLFLLTGPIGAGPAAALVVVSRLTLTVNELGAAIPFLLGWIGRKSDG